MTKICKLAIKTLEDHKAEQVSFIDLKNKNPFCDGYVIGIAGNKRQLNALAELVEDELSKANFPIRNKDGKAESGWVIIDAYEVIIHIFSKEEHDRIMLEEILSKTNK